MRFVSRCFVAFLIDFMGAANVRMDCQHHLAKRITSTYQFGVVYYFAVFIGFVTILGLHYWYVLPQYLFAIKCSYCPSRPRSSLVGAGSLPFSPWYRGFPRLRTGRGLLCGFASYHNRCRSPIASSRAR